MGRIPNSLALVDLPVWAVVSETEGMNRVICRRRSKPDQKTMPWQKPHQCWGYSSLPPGWAPMEGLAIKT